LSIRAPQRTGIPNPRLLPLLLQPVSHTVLALHGELFIRPILLRRPAQVLQRCLAVPELPQPLPLLMAGAP
jgi:hypothetical protein